MDEQNQAIAYGDLFIGGAWVTPSADERIDVISPNTGLPVGSVPHAGQADVDAAVRAARAAADDPAGWAHWAPAERAYALVRLAEEFEKRERDFAQRVSMQNGMPITTALSSEATNPSDILRYYASLLSGETEDTRDSSTGGRTLVRRLPLGVVAIITPWNFPQVLAAYKYAPALAAGCTIVLKPSPETVLDAMLLAEVAASAGLPPGVFNVIPGGRKTGSCLVSHPDVDKVAFTGSTSAGRSVGEVCGRLLRPVSLELGGKSAAIILDDANLDLTEVGDRLTTATFRNNGQTCFIASRVLAPRSRYTEVVEVFAEVANSLVVGHSLDPATECGPLVSRTHRDRVEGYVAKGVGDGARLVAGGSRPAALPDGWFLEPTVFADVDNRTTIAQEEIFGPVLTITPYDDDAEAVSTANDSHFGLGGVVFTSDHDRGVRVAKQIRTGTIGINGYSPDFKSPFSGLKDSGLGHELGPEAIGTFQHFQSVYL